ncbi:MULTISPECIES: DUF1697 domain-containing protein [Mumia]|uniref:DUF1697 domain-containing protein n=1 Tax=Mumia TaxID=1546255 RepID=UPI001AB0311A|nr:MULTISPECIES: DUF1697 domain-containing protein [unclassified Mumia]
MAASTSEKVAYLLRAVNVGGNKVPMAELRTLASDLGAEDVATYVNSGNLVCVPPGDADDFGTALAKGIADQMGVTTDAVARTGAELRAAQEAYPFEIHDPKFCHVWFFTIAPSRKAAEAVEAYDFGDDRLRVLGRELHLWYADGAGRSAVTAPRLLKLAGVPGTGRNLRTVEKLAAMAQ